MKPSYILLAILWIVYFFFHSFLASFGIKSWIKRYSQNLFKYYRLFYTVLALLGFLAIFLYSATIKSPQVFTPTGFSRFLALALATWGVIVIRVSFRSYSFREFIGLKNPHTENAEEGKLRTDGLLQYVRHPMYAGSILLIFGFWMYIPTISNLITAVIFILYIFLGIQLEEKKLIRTFGDQYKEYKKRVPMLIPRFNK